MASIEAFRQRLEFIVDQADNEREGIRAVARRRGVTERTVQRWLDEETVPSAATRESIRRKGRRMGAPRLAQIRDSRGRLSTTVTSADRNVRRGIRESRRETRNAAIAAAEARGDREALRRARNIRINLDRRTIEDLTFRRLALRNRTSDESWSRWRADYGDAMSLDF
jgi:hypothetical protein